jgi:hypothetical protein
MSFETIRSFKISQRISDRTNETKEIKNIALLLDVPVQLLTSISKTAANNSEKINEY